MIAHQIGIVICRVAAAVLLVETTRGVGFILPTLISGPDGIASSLLAGVMLILLPGLAAVGLWVFAARIVGVPQRADDTPEASTIEATDLVRVGTLLIGLYLLVTGVISGVSLEVSDFMQPQAPETQGGGSRYDAVLAGSRAAYVLRVLFGVALMTGRDRLAKLATRLRRAGTDA